MTGEQLEHAVVLALLALILVASGAFNSTRKGKR